MSHPTPCGPLCRTTSAASRLVCGCHRVFGGVLLVLAFGGTPLLQRAMVRSAARSPERAGVVVGLGRLSIRRRGAERSWTANDALLIVRREGCLEWCASDLQKPVQIIAPGSNHPDYERLVALWPAPPDNAPTSGAE